MKTLQELKEKYDSYKTITSEEEALIAVQQNGCALRHVHNQTEDICLLAVQQDGGALQYVHNQTEAICLMAVQQDEDALQYVHPSIFKSNIF